MKSMLAAIVVALLVSTSAARAQTHAGYRNFELGATVSSVSTEAKSDAANVKTIHERPALIQDLEWRMPYSLPATSTTFSDPVEQVDFSFYNNQLYKIVITYGQLRTAGMKDADLVEGISTMYGTPVKASAKKPAVAARLGEAENGTVIARWDGADQAVVLYRSADFFASTTARYWLIVTSPRLDALARTADAEASRLDEREAPQRAAAQLKKDAADARAADEKTRTENRAAFRP